jgi:hypothetical protein
MEFVCFSVLGVVLQSASLTVFILVSRTEFAEPGKSVALGAAFLVMTLLLWIWVRSKGRAVSLFLAPVALAVGYSVSFQLVGAAFSPGLLIDFRAPFDEFLSVLRVTANVFVMYGIATALLAVLSRWMARETQSPRA